MAYNISMESNKLAEDGTPWFPPLSKKQKEVLRRRRASVEITYDPDCDPRPDHEILEVLQAALNDLSFKSYRIRFSPRELELREAGW